MLNKELLMATGGKTKWYTKLTVGSTDNHYGYGTDKDLLGIFGSVSEEPSWNFKGVSCLVWAFNSDQNETFLFVDNVGTIKKYFSEITVTVVEKNLTVTFKDTSIFGYGSQTALFTPNDIGKTFTIGFDLPPDSYA